MKNKGLYSRNKHIQFYQSRLFVCRQKNALDYLMIYYCLHFYFLGTNANPKPDYL